MTVDQVFIIKKLQGLEEFFAACSIGTRMPFVTCDGETFNDQAWLFSEEAKALEFVKQYTERQMPMVALRIKKEEAPSFYMSLYSLGVNEVVFQDGEIQSKMELEKIVRIPEFDKLPENQRPLFNQQLKLSGAYFLQSMRRPGFDLKEADREQLQELAELEEELSVNLARSAFLMPISVEAGEDGQNRVRMVYVQNKNGDRFQPIFSDTDELIKHNKNKNSKDRIVMIRFAQLKQNMIQDVKGFVLNPEGMNLILSAEQITNIEQRYGIPEAPDAEAAKQEENPEE